VTPLHNKKFEYIYDVKTITNDLGRTYHTPDGSYPSITTVLGKTANAIWLQVWRAKVGEEEANRISKEATDRGELVHLYAERYFNGENIQSDLNKESPDVIQMSNDLIKIAETGVTEIWGQEQVLWSNKYKYAGRCDMVGKWKGVPSIIDFKTSKKIKNVSQIRDYFIQTCGYAVAHNEMYGTGIKNLVILITVDGKKPQKFETSAVPFLPELKQRRTQYECLRE
jgi:ATP-dependent exoDNAse (exonuclease V) beta subunit